MHPSVLQLDSRDNVLIALTDLKAGDQIEFGGHSYTLPKNVPAKHKFATRDLNIGDDVVMYGVLVGRAVKPIAAGELLTTGNIQHQAAPFHEQSGEFHWTPPNVSQRKQQTFLRISSLRRSSGHAELLARRSSRFLREQEHPGSEAGLRRRTRISRRPNSTATRLPNWPGCIEKDKRTRSRITPTPRAVPTQRSRLFENVDGIRFLLHEGGCGGTREDSNNLCGLIAGYIHHPNVAGATVLSLGCQHAQIPILRDEIRKRNPKFDKPLVILEQQRSGSEAQMMSDAIRQTFLGLVEANKAQRTPAPLADLCVGLKCGGSDGFSGISANPAIGHTADLLAALGGRTILSEFPELCGVEQELINRGKNKEVGNRFIQLMRDYAARAAAVRSGFDMNPSPGNMRDGLLTDAMKSAGAAKKGGTSPVTAVLDYPEYSTEPGLNLQCTPGNDVECVTAQVGAGASVVLFTTGLGTPTGNPITPVVKLSTNSDLARRMHDIIDIDTGAVVSGEKTIEAMGEDILDLVIKVANGEVRTKAEQKAQEDFIPWKRGVSL